MPLRGVNMPRPGSFGLNTQQDIVEDEAQRWASLATNGVIDESGKLAARQDFVLQTSGFSGNVEQVYAHRKNDGNETIYSVSGGKIYHGVSTFTLTGGDWSATSTTLNNPKFASLSSRVFVFQAGIAPFALNESTHAVVAITAPTAGWSSPNIVVAASGRLWVADDAANSNRHTLYWSNLLDGTVFNAGDAGSLNVQRVWPNGQDSITAVAVHQDRVIIFGLNNILLYTLPADRNPANMSLTDAVTNIGCIARDSVIVAGGDIYFLARDGYYKIPRLAQVTSLMSLVKVSLNVNDDFQSIIAAETLTKVRAGVDPKGKFLVLTCPTSNVVWCFHPDRQVPMGNDGQTIPAVTRWTNISVPFRAFTFDKDGNWYAGQTDGIGKYTGYNPSVGGNFYNFEFYTQWTSLQDETRLKLLKNWVLKLEAASGQTGTFKWQVDHKEGTTRTQSFTCDATEFAENPGIGIVSGQLGSEANMARFGFAVPVAGNKTSLHSMRLYAKPGRTLIR